MARADAGIRASLELRERNILAPYAAFSGESHGREHAEAPHAYRTAFQRDRDRILHTKSFRRLKRKTQVFCAPRGDHYRTRLTHTLEVSQIARTIARALSLNEDLTEAIALGHDLGHTPFGHAGETVLNELLPGGFHHAEQSVRVVEKLESSPSHAWSGINLTFEVRDGIRHHSRGKALLMGSIARCAATLEGDVLSISDAIAYVNHDIDDALRAGIISLDDLPKDAIALLGATSSQRISHMVTAVIEASGEHGISMTPAPREAMLELRTWLYTHLYPSPPIEETISKARKTIRELTLHHFENPTVESSAGDPDEPIERRTADYIAGMTDDYALELYTRLFLPGIGSSATY